jgi:hypothetical protein
MSSGKGTSMSIYLLVCEKMESFEEHVFSFVESFSTLGKAQAYAKSHSDFVLDYKADMEWIQARNKNNWRVEIGSHVYTIYEKEMDKLFDE